MSSRGLLGVISLFGFQGLATLPVLITDTDSGVVVDGAEVAAQAITDTDLGAGVDGTEVVAPAISSVDVGIGVDGAEVLATTLLETDSGTSSEAQDASGTGLKSTKEDSGKVVETESLSATLSDTDVGVGTDSEVLATDQDLEVCIVEIVGDLTIALDITSEECD